MTDGSRLTLVPVIETGSVVSLSPTFSFYKRSKIICSHEQKLSYLGDCGYLLQSSTREKTVMDTLESLTESQVRTCIRR